MAKREVSVLDNNPLWYKDAVIYELHVRAFFDSDGNGIGDFQGLTEKLDYLQDLGVTTLWLLPFYPSPLKDDGYDIAYYNAVNPNYGTLKDFKKFMKEAHNRGLRVITELVLNHTSDQHPWFQRARKSQPGSVYRDFYVWSDTAEEYKDTRIIFQDYEASNWTWDPVAKAYFWHRFFSHQPDLNFENPKVRESLFSILKFWLSMGVDGLRLDAIPYLYEAEGTNCENLPATHEFLKEVRKYVDSNFDNCMLLAEANQWPEDAVTYFGEGDECHMAFHFPLMPRLFMSLQLENRHPIIDILDQTPGIPENCQWAIFLRNHDELTLEMVTDEERDYMYRVYAQNPQSRINVGIRRRLAPLLGNDRRKIELMNGLLFSLPGTPVIYYGDEIGMGDNIYLGDRDSVRTPMQWSADRNAGFSRANPQQLYLPVNIDPEHHFESVNVEAQLNNSSSLLWAMKRLIAIRRQYKALGHGSIEFLHPENRKVLTFIRQHEDETILVVANLSRYLQYVEMDLSKYMGMVPIEIYSRMDFPPIGELPYFLTLAPHSIYWFKLEHPAVARGAELEITSPDELPTLNVRERWDGLFTARHKRDIEKPLIQFIKQSRWFRGKTRKIKTVDVIDMVRMQNGSSSFFVFVEIDYTEGDSDIYVLPFSFATGQRADDLRKYHLRSVLANVYIKSRDETGVIYEAFLDSDFCNGLLERIGKRSALKGSKGTLQFSATKAFRQMRGKEKQLDSFVSRSEQSNTSVFYRDRFILKLYRRIEPGINPDLELGMELTQRKFEHSPPVAGWIEYRPSKGEQMVAALLQGFVTNEGDAWQYTLDELAQFIEHAQVTHEEPPRDGFTVKRLIELIDHEPPYAHEVIGPYLESAWLLGHRTAEMHQALAKVDDPEFEPEPFSTLYQRSLYQSQRSEATHIFHTLRRIYKKLPDEVKPQADQILSLKDDVIGCYKTLLNEKIEAERIRCHGDYHLGQVLYTGKDFVIIDFEGEPLKALSERRLKRSPLRDVAGMLRSFHYASYAALFDRLASGVVRDEERKTLEDWIRYWYLWVSVVYFKGYLEVVGDADFIPQHQDQLRVLLESFLLEKAMYELGYEMNNRPDWLQIPIQGILQLVDENQ